MPDDPDDIRGAFCCVASLPAQGRGLARLASAFRFPRGANDEGDAAVARALSRAQDAWTAATSSSSPDTPHGDGDGSPTCRVVRTGSSSLTLSGGGPLAAAIETFTHPKAGLAVLPRVRDLIHLCPILSASASTTLARVVPYSLATPTAFVAIAGAIDNAADLERRYVRPSRRPSSATAAATTTTSTALRGAHSLPLPNFEAARDAALADEVACLSLTPPASSASASLPGGRRDRAAALSGVRRAVDAGEAAARAVLALVEDALSGSGARAADWPAQALELALAEVQGAFTLALHDSERGFTLAARDASGEEALWFSFAPDGSSVAFASPRPISGLFSGEEERWYELPPGHFAVFGGGFGRQPRLHQFALSREQLSVRTASAAAAAGASQEYDDNGGGAGRGGGGARSRDGVPLQSASAAAAAAAAAIAPVSPHSSGHFDDDEAVFYE